MKNYIYLILLVFLMLIPLSAKAEEVNRHILAVVDQEELRDALNPDIDNYLHMYAQTPLNHLGFVIDFIDATQKLPSDSEMKKYRGIISWFRDNRLKNAAQYAEWITRQLNNGRNLVVFDNLGFDFNDKNEQTSQELMDEFFKAFHVEYSPGDASDSPLLVDVVYNDPKMTEFERSLKGEVGPFVGVKTVGHGSKVFLKLKRKDRNVTCDAVFVNSRGGFAYADYAAFVNPIDLQSRWRIDPFKFLEMAFDANFPRPDISTQNGARLFYSHLDGDGIRNISYTDRKSQCGTIAFEKLFTQRNVPITSSVVIGDLLEVRGKDRDELFKYVKKIFGLPNIEPASHGWTHPLVWKKEGRKLAYHKILDEDFSFEREISGSIEYINENLAPPDKKTDIFFWTGDCSPDYEALKYVYDHGIMSVNGGDSRFDDKYPSYTFVTPLFREVAGLKQYYSATSNENTYTNLWTGPFYGYILLIETLKKTESPIRIRPIDIYYHMYTMEHDVSIEAINDVYGWSIKQDVAPEFMSNYIDTLTGFLNTRIENMGSDKWKILDNGTLLTVRFDNSQKNVDMVRSKGVLGFDHYQGSLYVHLSNGDESEIQLTIAKPSRPYLVSASGKVKEWEDDSEGVSFNQRKMGLLRFKIGGLQKIKEYEVAIGGKKFKIKSNSSGEVEYEKWTGPVPFKWVNVVTANRGGIIPGSKFEWVTVIIE